jgi:trans-2,3-dihydro-3-hydroxyanthranilate isomerase
VQITRDASGQVTQCTLTSPRNPQSRVQLLAPAEAAALLSLPLKAIAALPIAPWSCGVPFLVIPIASVQALSDCALDPARWKTLLKGRWAEKTYPAFIDAAARTARVRMFKATASVMEDPATGAAAAAMAGYLAAHIETQNGRFDWTLLQGQDMGRPSEIALRFDRLDGYAQNVQVGGAAVAVMRGELAI